MNNSKLCHFIGDERNEDVLLDRLKAEKLLSQGTDDEVLSIIRAAFAREARGHLAVWEREPLPKNAPFAEKLKRVMKPGDFRAQSFLCNDLGPYLSKAGLELRDQTGPLEGICAHCGHKYLFNPRGPCLLTE